jgi:hypothetical protein
MLSSVMMASSASISSQYENRLAQNHWNGIATRTGAMAGVVERHLR